MLICELGRNDVKGPVGTGGTSSIKFRGLRGIFIDTPRDEYVDVDSRKRLLDTEVRYVLLLSMEGDRVCKPSDPSVIAVSLLIVGASERVVERSGDLVVMVGLKAARMVAAGLFSSSANSRDEGVKGYGEVWLRKGDIRGVSG